MMNSPTDDPTDNTVKNETELVERYYNDCAAIYAEVRAEAAGIRGDDEAAKHWERVRDNLDKDKKGERA